MFDGNFNEVSEGRKFDSGYIPVESGLTLKEIKDRHEFFIADTNSLSGILMGLNLYRNLFFKGNFIEANYLVKTMYGQMKVISELAQKETLVTLRRILRDEYRTDIFLNSFLKNSDIKEIEMGEEEAIRLAKTISFQLSLREKLTNSSLNFMSPERKRFLEVFLESKSCIRQNGVKIVNDIDIMVYVAGLFSTNQEGLKSNCAILSWDSDLLVQKPLPRRAIISNKQKKKLISRGITSIPKFFKSPIIYHPNNQQRIGRKIPDTFLRYENPVSYEMLSIKEN